MWVRWKRTPVQPPTTPEGIALPDLGLPSKRRQRALQDAFKANEAARKPPCLNVRIETLGEVLWALSERGWRGGVSEHAPLSAPDWLIQRRRDQRARAAQLAGKEQDAGRPQQAERLVQIEPAVLRGANLQAINLNYADLRDADLRDADLRDSQLVDADLTGALLTEANLAGATLLRDEDITALRALKLHNDVIQRPPYYRVAVTSRNQLEWIFIENTWSGLPALPNGYKRPDLSGADLSELDLSGVDFVGARLSGTSLIMLGEEREFRRRFALNTSKGRAPYDGVKFPRHQHVLWVMRERRWHAEGAVEPKARINLIHADLTKANLSGMSLRYANLSGASFKGANLRKSDMTLTIFRDGECSGADLRDATLLATNAERSHFDDTNMWSVDIRNAELRGAILSNAYLDDALLIGADLRAAELRRTFLYGADLSTVRLDANTVFEGAWVNELTVFGENKWSEISLSAIQWLDVGRLGDELVPEIPPSYPPKLAVRLRDNTRKGAVQTYRGLELALRTQGVETVARRFHLRYERLRRVMVYKEGKKIVRDVRLLFSLALDALVGYGEAPVQTFLIYVGSVFAFSGVYAALVGPASHISSVQWPDWLLYSFVTFHGRGLFDNVNKLTQVHGWLPVVALLESALGIAMEFIFVAAFTRRFLGE